MCSVLSTMTTQGKERDMHGGSLIVAGMLALYGLQGIVLPLVAWRRGWFGGVR